MLRRPSPSNEIEPLIEFAHDADDIMEPPRSSPDGVDYLVWIGTSYKSLFDGENDLPREEFIKYQVTMDAKSGPNLNASGVPTGKLKVTSQRITKQDWEKKEYA